MKYVLVSFDVRRAVFNNGIHHLHIQFSTLSNLDRTMFRETQRNDPNSKKQWGLISNRVTCRPLRRHRLGLRGV